MCPSCICQSLAVSIKALEGALEVEAVKRKGPVQESNPWPLVSKDDGSLAAPGCQTAAPLCKRSLVHAISL